MATFKELEKKVEDLTEELKKVVETIPFIESLQEDIKSDDIGEFDQIRVLKKDGFKGVTLPVTFRSTVTKQYVDDSIPPAGATITFVNNRVFDGTAPGSFTDLDLSSIIGMFTAACKS